MKLMSLPALQHHGLQLEAILVTHHDADPSLGARAALSSGRRVCISPLLPTRESAVTGAPRAFGARPTTDAVGVFAAVRQWKNQFR